MKYLNVQLNTQGRAITRSAVWKMGGFSSIIVLALTLAGCQSPSMTRDQESASVSSPSASSIQPTADQSTAELWIDPQSLDLIIELINLQESLSGISVRVQVKPTTTNMSFKLSDKPFILPQPLLDQGWTAVINTSTPTASGEVWADLALINTQPEGIALTDTTTIATLAPMIQGDWADSNFILTLDPDMTKVLTKSAHEVDLSLLKIDAIL